MNHPEGFWYSVGHAFYKYFGWMESIYDHISPNKVFIALGFICFAWWLKWQADYTKKAIKEGKYK